MNNTKHNLTRSVLEGETDGIKMLRDATTIMREVVAGGGVEIFLIS